MELISRRELQYCFWPAFKLNPVWWHTSLVSSITASGWSTRKCCRRKIQLDGQQQFVHVSRHFISGRLLKHSKKKFESVMQVWSVDTSPDSKANYDRRMHSQSESSQLPYAKFWMISRRIYYNQQCYKIRHQTRKVLKGVIRWNSIQASWLLIVWLV